ncbi:MAG: RES family NAD+ phosphorylase [Acidimicrobiales bacterium]
MRAEVLPEKHTWLRIADWEWSDPLDPTFARASGGRWNPPGSFPVLYLNEDLVTARLNLRLFIDGWPFEPEDLRHDTGPCLVEARLPRAQRVADVHTPAGVAALRLPASYPLDGDGRLIGHKVCQPIGVELQGLGLRGVRCRSARAPDGAGRELAWFPATRRSRARLVGVAPFEAWFYS